MQAVVASPYYQQLMDRASKLDHTVKESEEKIAQLTKEVEEHTQREQLETANVRANPTARIDITGSRLPRPLLGCRRSREYGTQIDASETRR